MYKQRQNHGDNKHTDRYTERQREIPLQMQTDFGREMRFSFALAIANEQQIGTLMNFDSGRNGGREGERIGRWKREETSS